MATNDPVRISGNIGSFTGKAAKKEGEPKSMIGKLCIPEPNIDLLADLCVNAKDAGKAMLAAEKAHGKVEIPARKDEMTIRYYRGGGKQAKAQNSGATMKKVIYDCRDGSEKAELHYGEPLLLQVAEFMLENLGSDITLDLEVMQKDLGLDV